MTDPIKIISKCAGINNKVDPKWLRQNDPQTGLTDLAEGQNFDVDDAWKLAVRLGQVSLSSTASHSLFCNKGDGFVAQDRTSDAAIYKLNNDLTLTGVRSGLTKGSYLSYAQVGTQTFYVNGVQNGVITAGTSSAWPDQSAHIGAGTTRAFYPAPVGNHIEYWLLSMWIALEKVIYVSEPATVGKFALNRKYFEFGANVRMMKGVEGGMWVSTAEEIGFIARADNFKDLKWIAKPSKAPAHEWSVNCQLVDLSNTILKITGESAIWSSDDGLCIGTQDGQLIIVTEEKLFYPTGAMGATVVDKDICINSIW